MGQWQKIFNLSKHFPEAPALDPTTMGGGGGGTPNARDLYWRAHMAGLWIRIWPDPKLLACSDPDSNVYPSPSQVFFLSHQI
jgi:hypothetical protein